MLKGASEEFRLELSHGDLEVLKTVGDEVDDEKKQSMGQHDVAEEFVREKQVDHEVRQDGPEDQRGVQLQRAVALQDASMEEVSGRVELFDDLLLLQPAFLQKLLQSLLRFGQHRHRIPAQQL